MSLTNTLRVSDADSLRAALSNAKGGETIVLTSGDYGALNLAAIGRSFGDKVIITSEDPDAPARFSEMELRSVANLAFQDVIFRYEAAPGALDNAKPFEMFGSSDIEFLNVRFIGTLVESTKSPEYEYGTGFGLYVQNSSNITISGSEFADWARAAIFTRTSGIEISGNDVHDIRSDGMDFAQVTDVLIEDNWFHDFSTASASGDHADMIQFWTSGTTAPSERITIRGNVFDSGDGGATQGIFMRNELVDSWGAGSELFYRDLLIENNLIYNGHLHGITVGEAAGVSILNNTLLRNADAYMGSVSYAPQIQVASASEDVTVTGNIAAGLPTAQEGWNVSNNLIPQSSTPLASNYYGHLFVNALSGGLAGVAELQAVPGSAADGLGAALTAFDATPDALTALARAEGNVSARLSWTFDGSLTADAGGFVDDDSARFIWDFGDGQTAEGQTAAHVYATHGDYVATLTVYCAGGQVDSTAFQVRIADPVAFDLDTEGGAAADGSSYGRALRGLDPDAVEGGGVRLDGDSGAFSLDRGADGLGGAASFELSFEFAADGGESWGEIFRIHGMMIATLQSNGGIALQVWTAEGEQAWLSTGPGPLLDGDAHEVALRFGGGMLEILVDGVGRVETELDGHMPPTRYWGLDIGSAWGRKGAEGLLGDFVIRTEAFGETGAEAPSEPDAEPAGIFAEAPADTVLLLLDGDDAPLRLIGDAKILPDGGLRFDGEGDAANLGRFKDFEPSKAVSFAFTVDLEDTPGADGRVFWNHARYGVWISDSSVELQTLTTTGLMKTVARFVFDPNLNGPVRIGATIDSETNEVALYIDGEQVTATTSGWDIDIVGNKWHQSGIQLGGSFGRDIAGTVTDFMIVDEILDSRTMAVEASWF